MTAAGITVVGQVLIAVINRKSSQPSTNEDPEGKPPQKRRILPIIALTASIAAPLAGLLLLSRSQQGVTSQFIVIVVVLAALFVISLILAVAAYLVRRYIEQAAESQRDLMVLLQDREHRHDKDMQRRAENIRKTGIASMREIGGG